MSPPSSRVFRAIADLPPACFSFVMATGAVSVAANLLKYRPVDVILFGVNIAAYIVLWTLTAARLLFFPARVASDMRDHGRGVGFFTTIAATGVLGSQFILQYGNIRAGLFLYVLGLALWAILMCGVFTALVVRPVKPRMSEGLNGTWLVSTVGTQSLAVLGALLSPHFPGHRETLLFLSLALFVFGGMLYVLVFSMIFERLIFVTLEPAATRPTYWIATGACAITTLAGAMLIINGAAVPFFHSLEPFVFGFSVLFWATGTAWIPLLLILGIWRHLVRRIRLVYSTEYWGLVFPLGMYTVATDQFSRASGLSFLMVIPIFSVFAAFLAWGLTFAGLLVNLWTGVKPQGDGKHP